jgi:ribosomal protein S1
VHAGDVVDVMVDHGERPEGYVLLSHVKAARLRVWTTWKQLSTISSSSPDVLAGLRQPLRRRRHQGFMPGSQADPRPLHNLMP